MSSFTPDRTAQPAPTGASAFDHNDNFRKDTHVYQADIRLSEIREQHERHRSIRHGERHGSGRRRSLRRRLGESLMRLGQRVGGDTLTTPAWQG